MNTQYLKEFIALAECGNFSDAAAQLYISQSSLSKHIRALEAEQKEAIRVENYERAAEIRDELKTLRGQA